MTNKKAYNKIDNLCCLNATRYQKDFFKDYDGTDEDLCKDTYEMVDCLETIKQSLDKLEKLEKVIEIIKPYLYFHTSREKISFVDYKIDTSDNKENYDLLKEVFENE